MLKTVLCVIIAFIMGLFVVAPTQPASAQEDNLDNTCRGIDVSAWQGSIDFDRVKAGGIEAVYIRACYGASSVDQYFERNYEGAKKAGLKYGFYHYVTARNERQAVQQADFFADLIKTKPYDMRAAMDFENLSGLNEETAVAIAKAYLDRLQERLAHTPVMYSDAYDIASVWRDSLKKYPLWVADYGVSEPYTTGGWGSWAGFQYDDKGQVRGISGHVDLDKFTSGIFLSDDEKRATKKIRHDYSRDNDGCDCKAMDDDTGKNCPAK